MGKIFLLSISLILLSTACQNQQAEQIQQGEESLYYHWICQYGEHQGAEIIFVCMNNVFRGEYIDPYFQERIGIPIMGMIDNEGNVTGVTAVMLEGNIKGKLSGKITDNKFNAVWLPTPTGMETSAYREMELVLNTSGEQKNGELLSIPKTPFSDNLYGYTIGEREIKFFRVAQEQIANNEEVIFHIHIEESGIDDVIIDIQGSAQLNGNSFRYKEKAYEFEIAVYNDFITLTTISGDWDGYKADGVYPINNTFFIQ